MLGLLKEVLGLSAMLIMGQFDMFLPRPPAYSFQVCEYAGETVLCIVDEYDEINPTLSVTNGAELVLAEIAKKLSSLPEIIIYRDTMGMWDRLKASIDGDFLGFALIVVGRIGGVTGPQEEAVQLAVAALSKKSGNC